MKFWLIQRGIFRNLKNKDYKGLTGREGLIELDYMGSAEFEWGAIPAAYARIMGRRDEYIFHYCHDIKDYRGKIMVIFCRKQYAEQIENEIKHFIEHPYGLKEFCTIKDHINHKPTDSKFCIKYNFFWCIDNNEIGDWMGWFGMNKLTPFKTMLDIDYNEWWLKLTDEERNIVIAQNIPW